MEMIAIWKHDLRVSFYAWGWVKLDSWSMNRAKVCVRCGDGSLGNPDRPASCFLPMWHGKNESVDLEVTFLFPRQTAFY